MIKRCSIILILFLSGCTTCDEFVENFRKKDIEMIVSKKYIKYQKQINFEGVNLKGETVYFDDIGFRTLYGLVEVGDTLIKKIGSATVAIHRKDTVINHVINCDGKVYE